MAVALVAPLSEVGSSIETIAITVTKLRISVVQQVAIGIVKPDRLPQLLQRPLRSRMFGDIEMKQTSGSDLERNEYIKDTEAYRHGNEEVAVDNSVCMVAEEGGPALILAAARAQRLPDVFSNRAW